MTGYPFSPEAAYRIREEKTSLLHLHCPIASALLARQIRESQDLPLVLTWHTKYDIDIANAIHGKLLQEGALRALLHNVNACDEVWTVSEGAGENLRSLGYEGDILVMPNGVDLPHAQADEKTVREAVRDYDLPDGVPVFLFVGRLMWYKGIRIILDALKLLLEEHRDFRMIFVGNGTDAEEIRAYCRELGLDEKCFFTGAIRDRDLLRAWYTRADLFLFPSTFDTNGLVVREAAASDLATVMVRGSCAAEGVTDGQNGFMIDENADSLAAMLRQLGEEPERMKQVGEAAGRELYLSWADAVAQAYDRYEAVIDNYRSGRYPKRLSIEDGLYKSQGELMEAMGFMDSIRRDTQAELKARMTETRTELEARVTARQTELEAFRQERIAEWKALQEEFRQEMRSGRDQFREKFDALNEEFQKELERRSAEMWDRLERYL